MKKRIIGISSVNMENTIGSIFTCLVVIPTTFQRKFPKVDTFFNPQWLVKARKYILQHEVGKITPNHMSYGIDLLLNEQYGNIINRVEKFWDNTEIIHDVKDLEPKLGVQAVKNEEIDSSIFHYAPKSYVVKVAKQFANMYLFQECVEIKKIYGEFGKGNEDPVTVSFIENNPTCPWIRK